MTTASTAPVEQTTTPVQKPAPKRIAGIDLAEAICIFIVVIYHLSLASYKLLEDRSFATIFHYYIRCYYSAGCPIFFMCNGYLLFSHRFNFEKHVKKTFRMFLLTLFWFIPPTLTYDLVSGIPFTLEGMKEVYLTFRGTGIHLWYMGALVVIYVLFPMMKKAYDADRRIFFAFWLFIFAANFGNRLINQGITLYEFFFKGYRGFEQDTMWFSAFNILDSSNGLALSYFGIGAFLQDIIDFLEKHLPNRARRNALLTIGMMLAAVVHGLWFLFIYYSANYYICPVWHGFNTVSNLIIAVSILLLCMNYQGKNEKIFKVVCLISNNTLGIYFLHQIFLFIIKPVMETRLTWLCNLPGNFAVSVIVLVLCLGVAELFHRIPVLKQLL